MRAAVGGDSRPVETVGKVCSLNLMRSVEGEFSSTSATVNSSACTVIPDLILAEALLGGDSRPSVQIEPY